MLARGIIVTPVYVDQHSHAAVPPYIDPSFLRKCVLYWDMIDCPDDALGKLSVISNPSELELLNSEGILQRTTGYLFKKVDANHLLSLFAEHPYEFCLMAQLYALKKHYLSGLPERWSIGQIGTRLNLPDSSISRFVFLDREGVGLQKPNNVLAAPSERIYSQDKDSEAKTAVGIELFRSLPVPSQDVPIAEILEFKYKRWDELLRFRHAMDGLYDKAINSQDVPRAIEYAVDEIGISLRDIDKAMGESFPKRILATIKPELSLNDIVTSALAGGFVGSQFGLPQLGAVAGAVYSALRISLDSSLFMPRQIPPEFRDYAYIYHAGTELSTSVSA
jgi:hypothetical protein